MITVLRGGAWCIGDIREGEGGRGRGQEVQQRQEVQWRYNRKHLFDTSPPSLQIAAPEYAYTWEIFITQALTGKYNKKEVVEVCPWPFADLDVPVHSGFWPPSPVGGRREWGSKVKFILLCYVNKPWDLGPRSWWRREGWLQLDTAGFWDATERKMTS